MSVNPLYRISSWEPLMVKFECNPSKFGNFAVVSEVLDVNVDDSSSKIEVGDMLLLFNGISVDSLPFLDIIAWTQESTSKFLVFVKNSYLESWIENTEQHAGWISDVFNENENPLYFQGPKQRSMSISLEISTSLQQVRNIFVDEDVITKSDTNIESFDIGRLRKIAENGLNDCVRGFVWQILLGSMLKPRSKDHCSFNAWKLELHHNRMTYEHFLEEMLNVNIDEDGVISSNHIPRPGKLSTLSVKYRTDVLAHTEKRSYTRSELQADVNVVNINSLQVDSAPRSVSQNESVAKENVETEFDSTIGHSSEDQLRDGSDRMVCVESPSVYETRTEMEKPSSPSMKLSGEDRVMAAEKARCSVNINRHINLWYEEDLALSETIAIDVARTLPHIQFFLTGNYEVSLSGLARNPEDIGGSTYVMQNRHLNAIERILFVHAKLNTALEYVQGMNDICGILYYVMANSPMPECSKYAEAFTYHCFARMMCEMQDLFLSEMDDSVFGIYARMRQFDSLLQYFDAELHEYLMSQGLEVHLYSFRWFTTLFSREFNLADVIRVWDSIIADNDRSAPLVLYLATAMVLSQKSRILNNDFTDNLTLLQGFPCEVDVCDLLVTARTLRQRMYDSVEGDTALVKLRSMIKKSKNAIVNKYKKTLQSYTGSDEGSDGSGVEGNYLSPLLKTISSKSSVLTNLWRGVDNSISTPERDVNSSGKNNVSSPSPSGSTKRRPSASEYFVKAFSAVVGTLSPQAHVDTNSGSSMDAVVAAKADESEAIV